MKNSIIAFVVFYLMIYLNCHAQVTTYDIGDYKLPDVQWRALETSFGMTGSNSSSKSNHSNTFGAPQSYLNSTENTQNSFNGGFGLNYSNFQNTRTLQRFTQAGVSSSYISRGEKSFSERISEQREFLPRMFVYCENRIYFRDNMFYEINPDARYIYMNNSSFQRRPENTDLDIKHQSHSLNASVPLKVGIGRIEQVQDARQAIYIYIYI
jgi:hypothetical protein